MASLFSTEPSNVQTMKEKIAYEEFGEGEEGNEELPKGWLATFLSWEGPLWCFRSSGWASNILLAFVVMVDLFSSSVSVMLLITNADTSFVVFISTDYPRFGFTLVVSILLNLPVSGGNGAGSIAQH